MLLFYIKLCLDRYSAMESENQSCTSKQNVIFEEIKDNVKFRTNKCNFGDNIQEFL